MISPNVPVGFAGLPRRPFGWDTIHEALTGPFQADDLAALTLELRYAGRDGMRHFHDRCQPRPTHWDPTGTVTEETYALSELGELGPSKQHRCAEQFEEWLPGDVRHQLTLLAHARNLTRPWRSAAASSESRWYEVLPTDFDAVTSGALLALADRCDAAGTGGTVSGQTMVVLAARLRSIHALWEDQLERADQIRAADPHAAVLAWQRARALPSLAGTVRQVRWAERIRYDMASDNYDAETLDMLEDLTQAGQWIAAFRENEGWQ